MGTRSFVSKKTFNVLNLRADSLSLPRRGLAAAQSSWSITRGCDTMQISIWIVAVLVDAASALRGANTGLERATLRLSRQCWLSAQSSAACGSKTAFASGGYALEALDRIAAR